MRIACLRTNDKIVLLTNLNKYFCNDRSEIEVNINNSSEKIKKNTAVIDEPITADCASVVYVCISCT